MTGSRVKQIEKYINSNDFCLTYGDGLSDVNINNLIQFHKSHNKIATVTAVRPLGRWGFLDIDHNSNTVLQFKEKVEDQTEWINGGFFVLSKDVFNYLGLDKDCIFEQSPLKNLANDGQLKAFYHNGFWYAMDTLRDKNYLNNLWSTNQARWKNW